MASNQTLLEISEAKLPRPPRKLSNLRGRFELFQAEIEKQFFHHPVIIQNPYTKWFKQGLADMEQLCDLILQFSVFSNHFIVIQAKRMVHATTEEGERFARYILMNECGVALDVAKGSTEGKTFATENAHINWLREIGWMLGLSPRLLGRWEIGSQATHEFLEGLDASYGSHDGPTGAGASFAIETWAAFGIGQGQEQESNNFWKELIAGIHGYNKRHHEPHGLAPIPVGFFQYHFQIESGHGANVWQELRETFDHPEFNEEKYIQGGRVALDSIYTFWLGLNESRKKARVKHEGPEQL